MIIDAHVHTGKGDAFTHPSLANADITAYVPRARAAGIECAVALAALHQGSYRAANEEVARLVRSDPGRWIGYVFVNPGADQGHVADMVALHVDRDGFKGIKVHWSNGGMTREIADVARARRLPVLYDPYGDTMAVELLAREYADVAWVIPHLSSFADDWKAQCAFVDQLARHPNVFTDTAGVRNFDLLRDAVRRAGAHKVLFGSDGPLLHPAVELAKVTALRLPPASERLVTGGNLLRLVKGVRRRASRQGRSRAA